MHAFSNNFELHRFIHGSGNYWQCSTKYKWRKRRMERNCTALIRKGNNINLTVSKLQLDKDFHEVLDCDRCDYSHRILNSQAAIRRRYCRASIYLRPTKMHILYDWLWNIWSHLDFTWHSMRIYIESKSLHHPICILVSIIKRTQNSIWAIVIDHLHQISKFSLSANR